jgi:transposase-like protein
MWQDYENRRRIRTLQGVVQLRLKIRRCPNAECQRYHQPYRPEAEGQWALPQQEFGLDVIALVGQLRHQEHRSVAEIHQQLQQRGLCVSERTVSNLIARYDELLALSLSDKQRRKTLLEPQQQVIVAIDGLQPDVGHEILWVIRECLSGEILLARTLLSATHQDLAALFKEVKQFLPVPIVGVISDGQHSIRKAVAMALPDVAHGLCHFHYLKEAAKQIYEADRHAKKELKKQVRGVRTLERRLHEVDETIAEVMQGYCQAVRSALTDDGRPPLDAAGLRLQERVGAIEQSLARVNQKGGYLSH